ncbi:unnamed protein product [Brassica oleracea var. botrytis]
MAQEGRNIIDEQVVVGEEKGSVRLATLNRPRQLNVISSEVVLKLAEFLETWEKDDKTKLILIKGAGRAFSAGGDLKMFYDGRESKDSCLEVVYRMYWLCYHIHSYKKTQVSLVNGISMGGGASLMVPMKFSVVTEKTVFATPEASIGFHTDCGFSYIHSRLPGHLGEFLALTGARLNGKELVAIGMATHFVPSAKLADLEARLVSLDSGDVDVVRSTIEEFSEKVDLDKDSILNKQTIIDECFSKESVKQIIQAFEAEGSKEGNEWITPVIKGLKRSSPTGLKITLRSIREGRKQTLSDCLKKEFRITINILRSTISPDVYEGIRALTIDKDSSPKWSPATLDEVAEEKINLVFEPLEDDIELHIPETEENRRCTTDAPSEVLCCDRFYMTFAGEFLALTGAILNGKEIVAIGMATHFVPRAWNALSLSSLLDFRKCGILLTDVVRSTIEEFSEKVDLDKDSILNKYAKLGIKHWGVRALTIAKDNCPRWNPATLDEVDDEKIKLVFKPLEDDLELRIPETEENRWEGKAETSGFASVRG